METETCTTTKTTPTAEGDVEIRCRKPAGHVGAGDLDHEGKHYTWPVRWRDAQPSAAPPP